LIFRSTLEFIRKIQDVSEKSALLEKRTGRSHSKKKKITNDKTSDDDTGNTGGVTTVSKRGIARKVWAYFSMILWKIINEIIIKTCR